MFGFIKPFKPELKIREFERFQSVYCGLCQSIKARYGHIYTLFLNYDCTYLALVLDSLKEDEHYVHKRCVASPVKKKCMATQSDAIDLAADVSVILVYHKLNDTISDENGIKRMSAKFLKLLLKRGYTKAKYLMPKFDAETEKQLTILSEIEKEKIPSIDRSADTFAKILVAAVPQMNNASERVLKEFFYHTGRYIYIIDACQDIKEDFESGNYNPVLLRWGLKEPNLTDVREEIETTLNNSLSAVYGAMVLLDIKRDKEIIENIICMGLPLVTKQVLDGTYEQIGGRRKNESI